MVVFASMFLLALSVWTVPLLRRLTVPTWLAMTIIAGVVVGPFFYSIPTPISLSVDRVLMVLVAGLLAVQWRYGSLKIPRLARHDWVMIAIVGWFLFRTLGATAPEDESQPFSRWLTYFAMPAMLYAMTRMTPMGLPQIRHVMNLMLGLGVYLAIIAVMEVSGRHGLVFPRYIVDPNDWEFFGRARGPLMNPTANGVYLTTTLAIASYRWLHAGRRGKVGYLLVIGLIGCGALLTLTRSVWLGSMLLAALLSIAYLPRWTRVLALASCVLVAGFALTVGVDNLLAIKRDKELSASAAAKSVELRPLLIVVAYEMFKDRPVMGHGFGGYYHASEPYHTVRGWEMPLENVRPYMQHNVLSSLLVDTGMIGLSLFGIWMITTSTMAWRMMVDRSQSSDARGLGIMTIGCVGAYLVNGMFHDVSVMLMVNNLLFFLGALTTNITGSRRDVPGRERVAVRPERDLRIGNDLPIPTC